MGQEVIQLDNTVGWRNVSQDSLHQVLKGGWGISKAKGHHIELPQSMAAEKAVFGCTSGANSTCQ